MGKIIAFRLLIGIFLIFESSIIFAASVLPEDVNNFVIQEALVNDLAIMGITVDTDITSNLPWSGTISSGWDLTLSDPYREGQMAINYQGVYDAQTDAISWSGTSSFINTAETETLTENGRYTNAKVDGLWSVIYSIAIAVSVAGVVVSVAVKLATATTIES